LNNGSSSKFPISVGYDRVQLARISFRAEHSTTGRFYHLAESLLAGWWFLQGLAEKEHEACPSEYKLDARFDVAAIVEFACQW